MRTVIACAALLLCLTACSSQSPEASSASSAPVGAADSGAAKAKAGGKTGAQTGAPAPMLAYSYRYRFELPASQARGLLNQHQQACEAAGPALCQVVSANSTASGRHQSFGRLEIRGRPDWLKGFRARLIRDAEGADGKVLQAETETEDLTRSMVDTEAALRAQTALQARLERLLAERPGTLADALAIEQELARVRGTIDATRSSLEVMRGRVQMSKLSVAYESRGAASPDSAWTPVMGALESFVGNALLVVGGLIVVVSFLLPLALLAIPVIWWRSRRPKRAAKPARLEP